MSVITKGDDGQPIPPPDSSFRIPKRTWIVWIAIIGAIITLTLIKQRSSDPAEILSQQRFEELLNQGKIIHGTVFYDNQSPLNEITGTYGVPRDGGTAEVRFRMRVRLTSALEDKLFSLPQFEPSQPNNLLLNVLLSILPFVIIGAFIWFFFIRGLRRAVVKASISTDPKSTVDNSQARFDKILDKWEQQAKRMDGVLDRMERDRRE
jgi:ATP-dependent Zn protease